MSTDRGYLQVRATIDATVDRDRFDHWYETVHVPQVLERLHASGAWRMWSLDEANVHYAIYEFATAELLLEGVASAQMSELVADFDATWGRGVARQRTIMRGVQRVTAGCLTPSQRDRDT